MMIVRKFEYLIALAREKHFARAASACHVSQPTLSAAIQQLEVELGVQIVKRGRRFEGFTSAGEIVLSGAQRMMMEASHIQEKLRDQQENLTDTLRIGVLGPSIPLMKTFTVPFQRRFPTVNLRVTVHNAFEIEQAIEECSIDVGITYLDKDLQSYGRSHSLYTEEYELLIRRGTKFSGAKAVSWEVLKELPLCLPLPSRIFGDEESEILNEAMRMTPHIVTTAVWMIMDHVRSGKWASVLPRPVRIMIAEDKELEAIPLPKSRDLPTVGIVLPKKDVHSPQALAFFGIAASNESLATLSKLLRSPMTPAIVSQGDASRPRRRDLKIAHVPKKKSGGP